MTHIRTKAARAIGAAALAGALAGVGACSLDVQNPGIVDPGTLTDATALPTLRAGAIGDFAIGFAGTPVTAGGAAANEGVILAGGTRADEFLNRDTFVGRRAIDVGNALPENQQTPALFRNIQRARRSAELAAARYAELSPDDPGHAEVLNLAGFATILVGETFCPGAPFSELNPTTNQIEPGPPLDRAATFGRAIERFTQAAAVAQRIADDTARSAAVRAAARTQLNLSLIGRARATLQLTGAARVAEAAALVAAVPTNFVYNVEFSTNTDRQNNGVFQYNNIQRRFGVADREGTNGLPFVSARDPRVPTVVTTRNGLDGVAVPIVNQLKYAALDAPIPLATGVEARLIQAEAALLAGDRAAVAQQLTAARTQAGLGAADLTGLTDRQVADLIFRERGFALFATGHRLGDMRRLLLPPYSTQFGYEYTQVFPVGQYFKTGGPYREQPSIPVPLEETNNSEFTACLAAN